MIGSATIAVHAIETAVVYPLAVAVSRIISSKRLIFRPKLAYLFTFSLLVGILPAGAGVDLLSDVLVIGLAYDGLVGPATIVGLSFAFAILSQRCFSGEAGLGKTIVGHL